MWHFFVSPAMNANKSQFLTEESCRAVSFASAILVYCISNETPSVGEIQ
jgi:hypothetical protein